MKKLYVLAADSLQKAVLEILLERIPLSSNTNKFEFECEINPYNDAGYKYCHEILRPLINLYDYVIVIFDLEGTGIEHRNIKQIESEVHELLNINGWKSRNEVIVIKPELENWMWIDNPNVHDAIGWENRESLYEWARSNNYILKNSSKPERPKETFEKALKMAKTPKSASIYKKIAQTVSYKKCEDVAFKKLIKTLQLWFPLE